MCGVSDGTHPLTVDDTLTYLDSVNHFGGFTFGNGTATKMCQYDASGNLVPNGNGIGQATNLEKKCGINGKAGTEACIWKMRVGPVGNEAASRGTPYTEIGVGGQDYTKLCGTSVCTPQLDLRPAQQTKPCSSRRPATTMRVQPWASAR
jgi:hypothetical protein